MPDHAAADLRSRATLLLIAGIVTDLAACATLVLPFVRGTDVVEAVPVAIPLFLLAALCFLGWFTLLKKARAASGDGASGDRASGGTPR